MTQQRTEDRRGLATCVLACVVGSLAALFAATRTWAVQVQAQPAPLAPLHVARAGTAEVPWLSALALVALAGAGALMATRGGLRAVVGGVVLLAGLGVATGGVYGLAGLVGVRVAWPLLCLPAGLLLAVAGALAMARGRSWPAMGARYDRPRPVPQVSPVEDQVQRIGPSPSDVAMWDALDRGEDPSR
jgi:Tryptophan-associated transmembrane protein (Trp_oprn_chp)